MRKIFCNAVAGIGILLAVSLFSCQPEVQPYTSNDSTGNSGLLSYVTGHTGSQDSFYVSYQYDAQNRWAGNRIIAISGGDTSKIKLIVNRDASGFITRIIGVDSSDLSSIERDTTVVQHNTAGRYTISYYYTNLSNAHGDTTEYIYDNSGKIIRTQMKGFSDRDTIRSHYTGSNLDSLVYSYGTAAISYSGVVFKYDTKVAPSNLGNEAFLLEIPFLYGTGNIISYTGFENNSITEQGVISYTFNSANKPVKAVAIALPANEQYTAYYHYQ